MLQVVPLSIIIHILTLTLLLGCQSGQDQQDNPKVTQQVDTLTLNKKNLQVKVDQLTNQNSALEAVLRLEKLIAVSDHEPIRISTMKAASTASSNSQKTIEDEHEKSKRDGYHRDYHDAIRKHGGKRLREEFNKHCNNLKQKGEAEVNCP